MPMALLGHFGGIAEAGLRNQGEFCGLRS